MTIDARQVYSHFTGWRQDIEDRYDRNVSLARAELVDNRVERGSDLWNTRMSEVDAAYETEKGDLYEGATWDFLKQNFLQTMLKPVTPDALKLAEDTGFTPLELGYYDPKSSTDMQILNNASYFKQYASNLNTDAVLTRYEIDFADVEPHTPELTDQEQLDQDKEDAFSRATDAASGVTRKGDAAGTIVVSGNEEDKKKNPWI